MYFRCCDEEAWLDNKLHLRLKCMCANIDVRLIRVTFFFLWLYSPILSLCRLHETFRFISITRSRTVVRTPWTGDQLVARPLLTAPGDCDDDDDDDGEVGGMNDFGKGNRSTRRKPAPTPRCSPQIPLARHGRLTTWAMARPLNAGKHRQMVRHNWIDRLTQTNIQTARWSHVPSF
jgi:hypothetical protein